MVKKLLFLSMLAIAFACSTDSLQEELPEPGQNFEVSLTPSVNEVFLDVPFTLKVQANEGIEEITRIFENGEESINSLTPGTALAKESLNLHLGFGSPGNNNVVLEFTSVTGKKVSKTVNFEVKHGNALKIVGLKINSFYNMNGSWDGEFSESDVNRLADIRFAFRKLGQGHISNPTPRLALWYLSAVYPNMEQLEWDLSQEELYILESSLLELSIGDVDEDGTGQDLTMGSRELSINVNHYRDTRPTEINLIDEGNGLDVTLRVEWL